MTSDRGVVVVGLQPHIALPEGVECELPVIDTLTFQMSKLDLNHISGNPVPVSKLLIHDRRLHASRMTFGLA
ncbi:hypothetical protein N7488_006051 [Penicillium malachiteum]|nr:hypothetical protein N7488_006051 [Penicillium malachiteum]